MTERAVKPSPRTYARIGGALYLYIIVAGGFAEAVRSKLPALRGVRVPAYGRHPSWPRRRHRSSWAPASQAELAGRGLPSMSQVKRLVRIVPSPLAQVSAATR
jgi:hypothetical protein